MNNSWYVYSHTNPITKEIFYIGAGTKNRINQNRGRNPAWKTYVKSLLADGVFYETAILHVCPNKEEALKNESLEIQKIVSTGKSILNRNCFKEPGNIFNIESKKESEFLLHISEYAKAKRTELGLTQAQLSKRIAVGRRFLVELEGGNKKSMRIDKINKVLNFFNAELGIVVKK